MNTMMDYLKNVTQGVAMVLTKIEGENKGKIQFYWTVNILVNLEKYPCWYLNMFPFLAIENLGVKVDALSDAVGDQSLMLQDFKNNTFHQLRSQNPKYKYPGT